MSELRQSQAEQNNPSAQYADLTAAEILSNCRNEDFRKLSESFASIQERQDTNKDGVLAKDELQLGMFQKNHGTEHDAIINKFLLKNYADLSGLSKGPFDKEPAYGVSESDMNALLILNSPNANKLLNRHRQEALLHVDDAANAGAAKGLVIGLVGTASLVGLSRLTPAKFRVPIAAAAITAPIIGVGVGAFTGMNRLSASVETFAQEKESKAVSIIANADKSTITAPWVYKSTIENRMADIKNHMNTALDVDDNGYVDKTELNYGVLSNTGKPAFNNFLLRNYDELELLSRSLKDKDLSKGISQHAIHLLTEDTYRLNHLSAEKQYAHSYIRAVDEEARNAKLGESVLLGGALAAGLLMATRFAPAKYRAPCYIGSVGAGFFTAATKTFVDDKSFLRKAQDQVKQQEAAIESIRSKL